ncbi:hypothetical protein WDU94_001012, partial [Cyamophila willieti]
QYGGDKGTPTRAPSNTNFTLSPLSPKGKEEPQPPARKPYGSGVTSIRDKYSTESADTRMKSPEPAPDKPKVSRFLHQKSQLVNPKSVIERVTFDLAKTENKFPEKKVKMVSRATSPSPPSNSVFLRQRRADLEKIVEIEVTRSKKYYATRSSEMQTDEHPPVPPPPPPTTVRTSSWNNRFSTTSPASSYSPSSSPAPSRYSSNTPSRLSSGYSYARPSDLPIRSSSMKPSDFSRDSSPAPRSPRLTSYKSDSPTSPTASKYSYTPRNDNSPVDSKPRLAFSYTPRSSGDVSPKIPEPPPAPLRTVSIGVTAKPPQSPRSANGGNPKLVNIDSPEFREAHMLELSNSISKMNLDQGQNGFKKTSNEPSSSSEEEEEEEEEKEEEEEQEEEEPEEMFKAHAYSLIQEFANQTSEKPPLPNSKTDPRSIIVRALAPVAGVKLEDSSNDETQKTNRSSSPSYHDASERSHASLHKSKSKSALNSAKQSDSSSSENARQFLNIPQRDIPKHLSIRKFDSCENNSWVQSSSPDPTKRSGSPRVINSSDISWGSSSEQEKSNQQNLNVQNYSIGRMDSTQAMNSWWNELKPLQNEPSQENNNVQGFCIRKMDSTHEPWWSNDEGKKSPQPPVNENSNKQPFSLRKMDSSDVPWWVEQQKQQQETPQLNQSIADQTNDSDRSTAELNQFYMNRANLSDAEKPTESQWWSGDRSNYPESGIGDTPSGEKCWWIEGNDQENEEQEGDVATLDSYDRTSKKQYLITKIQSGERAWWMGQEERNDQQPHPPTITTTGPPDDMDPIEDEEPLIDQLLASYRTHSPVVEDQYNFIGRHKNIDDLLGNEVPPPAAPVTPQSSDDGKFYYSTLPRPYALPVSSWIYFSSTYTTKAVLFDERDDITVRCLKQHLLGNHKYFELKSTNSLKI